MSHLSPSPFPLLRPTRWAVAALAAGLLAACGGASSPADDGDQAFVSAEPEVSEDDRDAPVDYGWGPVKPTMPMREQMRILSAAGFSAPSYVPASGGPDAHVIGAFGPAITWPVIPIHMVLLPDGRVMTYGTDEAGNQGSTLHYAVWDPAWMPGQPGAGTSPFEVLPNTTGTDLFCTTQLLLPQTGQVLMVGGDRVVNGVRNYASADLNIFDPVAKTLTKQPTPMAFRRWYGTAVTTANGEQLVLGGRDDRDIGATARRPATVATYAPTPEVYTPGVGWRLLTGATSNDAFGFTGANWNYPEAWLAPNGRVITISNNGLIYSIDHTGSGSITQVPGKLRNTASLTPSVMYAPGKILSTRNGTFVQLVDINGARPVVSNAAPSSVYRRWGFTTVLADGTVWMNGGSSDGLNDSLSSAIYTTELWNPATNTWTMTAPAAQPRMYHGTSLLLANGTVLTGGGGAPGPAKQLNSEVYFPPYLFNPDGSFAQRPQIASVSSQSMGWSEGFNVEMADDATVERVTLVRFGSSTHGLNTEQRHMDLPFVQSGNQLQLTTPSLNTVAPPGFYLLFVFTENTEFTDGVKRLVPSEAKVIRLAAD